MFQFQMQQARKSMRTQLIVSVCVTSLLWQIIVCCNTEPNEVHDK